MLLKKTKLWANLSTIIHSRFAVLNYTYIANLSPETLELRDTVRKFCDEKVAPLAVETDKSDCFPNHLWKEFGNMGLLGSTVPSSDI